MIKALLPALVLLLAAAAGRSAPLLLRRTDTLASFGQLDEHGTAKKVTANKRAASPWGDLIGSDEAGTREELTREDILRTGVAEGTAAMVSQPVAAEASASQGRRAPQDEMTQEEALRLQSQLQSMQAAQERRLQELRDLQSEAPLELPAAALETDPFRQKALVSVSASDSAANNAPATDAAAPFTSSLPEGADAEPVLPSHLPQGGARPKGWDQCLTFARYVREKQVSGVELVRTWKATCEPAVRAGRASERYRLMCDSLGGAVEPYSEQVDYSVEHLCDAVLAVFHDLTAVQNPNR